MLDYLVLRTDITTLKAKIDSKDKEIKDLKEEHHKYSSEVESLKKQKSKDFKDKKELSDQLALARMNQGVALRKIF